MLHHILPHSCMLGSKSSMETLHRLPALLCQHWGWCMAVFSCLVGEMPLLVPHSACMVAACEAACRSGQPWHGQAGSPAWEISGEAAFYKPHFHLTNLNIFQFQNTHLKITYRNIYMDTKRNFPALGIQPTAHGRAHNCLPVKSLFACY